MSSSYANRVTRVPLDHLVANPYQPRFDVNDDGIGALVDSIKEYGFVGHVEVRRNPEDPALPLQVVFGHRRVEAAKRAGMATIPAAIVDRSEDQMRRLTFVENAARKDLTYWEEAVFVGQMRQELRLSVRQLAAALGKPKSWVQERLDILRLPEGPLREAAQRDEIAFSAAWLLVQMDPKERDELFRAVKRGELNVSDLRALRHARLRLQDDEEQESDGADRVVEHLAASPRARPPRVEPTVLAAARTARWSPRRADDHAEDGGERSGPRPLPGRVFEVPRERQTLAGAPQDEGVSIAVSRAVAPPIEPAKLAAMSSRTAVLALAREMEITARSLQARLRLLDLARLTTEERTALDRARSGLQTVLAGIGEPRTS